MSRLSFVSHATLVLALYCAASFITASPLHAQADGGQPVNNIITADGVKIKGTFYENSKPTAPTVIMLHPIGEDKSSRSPEWKSLADALAKAGYSVLMFDFRGHGESTTIDDTVLFRSKPINNYVKSKDKETIDVKDYIKSGAAYLPVLVNDIAAARAWLDRRNDESKDCNTSSIMIIGADQGATLGAIWMNAEWHRYKYTPMFPTPILNPNFVAGRPEGKDIIAAVFLTPHSPLEKRVVSISKILRIPSLDNGTATTIIYGKDDPKAAAMKALGNSLKPAKKDSSKHVFNGPFELKTKLSGVKLLQKGLGTEKGIIDYLDSVRADRGADRSDHDFLNSYYVWRSPFNGPIMPAKSKKGDKVLQFDEYTKFVQ